MFIRNKMKFSSIIYPAPSPASYTHDKLIGELLYIPRDYKDCPDLYDIEGRISYGTGGLGATVQKPGSAAKQSRNSGLPGQSKKH